jgi:hypothetical protein
MRKCICGELLRSFTTPCPNCGRTHHDNAPFSEQLDKLELALSLISDTQTGVTEAESVARTCLWKNASLADVAKELDNTDTPAASHLARILRNLAI